MKKFFEMSQPELDTKLGPVIANTVQQNFTAAGHTIYRDEHCQAQDEFVREYADGRKEVVRVDAEGEGFVLVRAID